MRASSRAVACKALRIHKTASEGAMTLDEAEKWLLENASPTDHGLREEAAAGVTRLCIERYDMWGPGDFETWSREDLIWRVVFLQCVLRTVSG